MTNELFTLGQSSMSFDDLKSQIELIRKIMKEIMVEDVHYGKIPGCGDDPALLQAGAHKLGLLFNLGASYEILRTNFDNGHREYEVCTTLKRRSDGLFIGQGVGTCSTLESKYRYRWDDMEVEVPQDYWKHRDQDIIGGEQFRPRKIYVEEHQQWNIFMRVDHGNPSDYYNTCIKIGKKRSYNDAILTCTAASDIFIPDDDLPAAFITPDDPKQEKKNVRNPRSKSGKNDIVEDADTQVSKTQIKILQKTMENKKVSEREFMYCFELKKIEDLTKGQLNDALAWIANPQ